jgi:acyl carrier protein
VAGELLIGGAGVAREYAGRPGLTAERFVADPFGGDGSRLYRTGDRVRWSAAGQLEFLGRTDEQVKVRGFRVEPGEVESVLAAHPEVATAVVIPDGPDRLAGFIVPNNPAAGMPTASVLLQYLRERLPDFMVPSVFTELTTLPLQPGGKVNRAALPAISGERPELGGYTAPTGPVQEALAEIWAQILNVTQIGAHDSFFDLGGHSLLATQVISRVRVAFDLAIPLSALFDQPTVSELARVIEDRIVAEIEHMSEEEVLQTLNSSDEDGAS